MGILSVVNRNLASNTKSQLLKSLSSSSSSSSNLLFIRSISSPAFHDSAELCEAQLLVGGDLKSNNNKKPMFLIEHFHDRSGKYNGFWDTSTPPYNYSVISAAAKNSWKDHRSLCNPYPGECTIVNSCNELMLIKILSGKNNKMCLWNPTTNKIKILPKSDVPAPPPDVSAPTIIRHGFGFDPESEDYKLLTFVVYDYENDPNTFLRGPNVEMYSLKTNSWKKIIDIHPCNHVPCRSPSVHVNGIYYWVDLAHLPPIVISFDFATEKFSSFPLPRKKKVLFNFKDSSFVLVEFGEYAHLAALVYSELDFTEKPFSFEIWGWLNGFWLEITSRITIDVPGGVAKVLGLFQNKLFLQGLKNRELLVFDLRESKLENLGIHADTKFVQIFPYVGSSDLFHTMGNK